MRAIQWHTAFVVVDVEQPALQALRDIKLQSPQWMVCYDKARSHYYVWSAREVRAFLAHPLKRDLGLISLAKALELDPLNQSAKIDVVYTREPPDRRNKNGSHASASRYVRLDGTERVVAIGVLRRQRPHDTLQPVGALTFTPPTWAPAPAEPPRQDAAFGAAEPVNISTTTDALGAVLSKTRSSPFAPPPNYHLGSYEPLPEERHGESAPWPKPVDSTVIHDEGTSPTRHPSLEPDGVLTAGHPITIVVDLLRQPSGATTGAPLMMDGLDASWEELPISVTLISTGIEFIGDGSGTVTIRRNRASLKAPIEGRVSENLKSGDAVEVLAWFFLGNRAVGNGKRTLYVGTATKIQTAGTLSADTAAQEPDLTVNIHCMAAETGQLFWLMKCARFDGMPPQLRGETTIGRNPATESAAMYSQFSNLSAPQHRTRIEGFGEQLWDRTPDQFKALYWALVDHLKRPFSIQFITDEPYLPWELMRPVREGTGYPLLAIGHPVARWISRWDGFLRNRIRAGEIATIAPKYRSVSNTLSHAEQEAKHLEETYSATRIPGRLTDVSRFLEATPRGASFSIVHFAGHGSFAVDAANASTIKLEDGALAVSDVSRSSVKLGEHSHPLVFFNACEVGASGSALGTIGGWADAFLGRQFSGFIAPLWAVQDEFAATVLSELLQGIVHKKEPIGKVLQAIRKKYGAQSPTFYSYLHYGDVNATLE